MTHQLKYIMKQRLILVGGGHAQLSVLTALAHKPSNFEAVLITPNAHQIYSGMLPGWMAGHYKKEDCCIDLRPLANAARARMISAHMTCIDDKHQCVELSDGSCLEYDLLSINTGSEIDTSGLEAAGERLLPVKPLDNFVKRWPQILGAALHQDDYQLIVVGGGAAGVELAFAAKFAFTRQGCKRPSVALVASQDGLLPGHSVGTKSRSITLLKQRGITLLQAQAGGMAEGITFSSGESMRADCIIAATGVRPPAWLRNTDIKLDEQGYILVDAQQRSLSHPNVFAAGDVCIRQDIRLPRSGVHAVFTGPVLAHNLFASICGQKLRSYRPRKKSLYLLATGPRHAIASWGAVSAQGEWVWYWKNWIDRGFMRKYGVVKR